MAGHHLDSDIMSRARDSLKDHSSPHSSSEGVDSFKGTPDTRLNSISPDDTSGKSTKLAKEPASSASLTPQFKLTAPYGLGFPQLPGKDPFVTPSRDSPGYGKGLSPTASTFEPCPIPAISPPYFLTEPVSAALSTDIGLHRILHVSCSVTLSAAKVETSLLVCPPLSRQSRSIATNVYVL